MDVCVVLCRTVRTKDKARAIRTKKYREQRIKKEFRWGVRFSAPVQTGPGTHPDSYKMGTGSLYLE
jgi:hypothetical protein